MSGEFLSEENNMNKHDVLVSCDDGCVIIKMSKLKWEGHDEYFLEAYLAGLYVSRGFLSEIFKRLRGAWFMLRGRDFLLYDIVMNEAKYKNLVDAMVELQNAEE